MYYLTHDTPVGPLLITGEGGCVCAVYFAWNGVAAAPGSDWESAGSRLEDASRQLDEYFAGSRTAFELCLAPRGTPFQQEVWRQLRQIPYGETITYQELANRIGKPKAVRAVGAANGANPLSIVVPCHRVIGSNGKLVGFGGGLDVKRALLDLEMYGSTIR